MSDPPTSCVLVSKQGAHPTHLDCGAPDCPAGPCEQCDGRGTVLVPPPAINTGTVGRNFGSDQLIPPPLKVMCGACYGSGKRTPATVWWP